MQSNYTFTGFNYGGNVRGNRLFANAELCRKYGLGFEIELAAAHDPSPKERYFLLRTLELGSSANLGYQHAATAYYFGSHFNFCNSPDPELRKFYNAYCDYITGKEIKIPRHDNWHIEHNSDGITAECRFAEPVVIILLTDKWVSIVPLMQILVFNAVWIPFSALNINIICVVGHSDYVLKIELLKGILRIAAILLSMPYGLMYVCVALAVVSFLCSFIYTGHTKYSVGVNWWQQIKCMLPYILMSAVATLIGYIISCITTIAVVKLFVGIASFAVVYLLLLIYFDQENVRFVKSLIPHKHNI